MLLCLYLMILRFYLTVGELYLMVCSSYLTFVYFRGAFPLIAQCILLESSPLLTDCPGGGGCRPIKYRFGGGLTWVEFYLMILDLYLTVSHFYLTVCGLYLMILSSYLTDGFFLRLSPIRKVHTHRKAVRCGRTAQGAAGAARSNCCLWANSLGCGSVL